jgi:predicted O-linked N-acetylglucosamine transferase (SPINDLY family)
MAGSLLRALQMPELITDSIADYEALAIDFAMHPDLIASTRAKLASNRLTEPLFDTELFTRHLENAYTKLYERNQASLPPDHICIEE